MTDPRLEILSRTGPMKLHATALLARGDENSRFEAAVMLHEVVREERRAFELLRAPSPVTTLAAYVEEAWLLLDGLDPQKAITCYVEKVMPLIASVPEETSAAMCSRLTPRIAATGLALNELGARAPVIITGKAPDDLTEVRQYESAAKQYPGVAHFWMALGNLSSRRGDNEQARRQLERAYRLDPMNWMYFSARIAAASTLPLPDLDAFLTTVRPRLDAFPPIASILYCIATLISIDAHGPSPDSQERLEEVQRIVSSSASLLQEHARNVAAAVGAFATALRQGEKPTTQMLRDAGLGRLVDSAPPALKHKPIQILGSYIPALAQAA